ncbi:carbohydrate ABC transporter substrate-binding protein [Paenibacillus psychroresistens]|uniref:Carbohydrate ABC transporter substrate-binding protein n=1 Tax=Paenibacillus psychroresistens TaxID=1778678 RepID=A0A6B8RU16_9BACL|nr:ABC transporter substrate-binding protein [Paenibacillus psychroresistens]QGQ99417.1 carbohydrate ABC transporter substrate-binding protein [Paenibacillus psychroresistens]
MQRTQKKVFTIILTLLMAIVFTACGSGKTESSSAPSTDQASAEPKASATATSEPAPTEAPKNESVTLSMIISKDWYDEPIKWVISEYEKKSGNKIDVQFTPGGQAFNDAITTKAAVNEMPDIAFMYTTASFLGQMKAEELLVDLSNEPFMKKISPSIIEGGVWLKSKDKFYEIPVGGMNGAGVIYNKEIFAANGIEIPKTYEEFLAVCEKLKQAGITPIFEGLKDGWPPLLFNFIGFTNEITKKGDIAKINDGTFDFSKSAGAKNFLNRHHELFAKGYFNKDTASTTYDMEVAAFSQGKAAMVINVDNLIPGALSKFPEAAKFIGMFPLPWDNDPIIPIDLSIGMAIAKGKNQATSLDFLNFFTSDETLNGYYGKVKAIPPYIGVTAELNPGTSDLVPFIEAGKTLPFYANLITPGVGVGFDLTGVILGAKSVDKALLEAQAQYLKSLKDNKIAGLK